MTSRTLKVAPRETPKQRHTVKPMDPQLAAYLDIKDQLDVLASRYIDISAEVRALKTNSDRILALLEAK